MATLGIESNGRLEKTAVYYNGEQISGLKELLLNLDEDGTFDAVIQYQGNDNKLYNKSIFNDLLTNIKVVEPSFTEEEAMNLRLLEIDSNGDIENTVVLMNGEELIGLVNLYLHIKSSHSPRGAGLMGFFGKSKDLPEAAEFKAEFTFRNEDDSLSTEGIF